LWIVAAPVVAVIVYGVLECLHGDPLLAAVPAGTRQTFFASLAATTGALLGFAITGLTILLTLGGSQRMTWLLGQERFRTESRALFTTAIAALGFATAVFLLLIVVATDKDSFWHPWGYLCIATMALVAERLSRLVYFFHDLMGVALKDGEGEPVAIKKPFTEPLDD
jgi:hypothetical protein